MLAVDTIWTGLSGVLLLIFVIWLAFKLLGS